MQRQATQRGGNSDAWQQQARMQGAASVAGTGEAAGGLQLGAACLQHPCSLASRQTVGTA